ncbi:MAG TPA: hypothetical protein VMD30_12520 [Tepidisphaeraceae bacterium]|nr:hypothetical protein [Tepidisphaeraceae bacterium]
MTQADSPIHVRRASAAYVLIGVGCVALAVFLIVRWFSLINQYAVNTPVWDDFDFYFLLASHPGRWAKIGDHPSLWTLFDWQWGPHRMGIGLIASKFLLKATHWNIRAEAFFIGVLVTIATGVALLLKWRLFGGLAWYDILIPLLMLTPSQYDIWASTPDSSHGAFPLLFVFLSALAWTAQRWRIRYPWVLLLCFLATFTGFGFFLAPATAVLLLLHLVYSCVKKQRQPAIVSAVSLGVVGCMIALYFVGYKFNPSNFGFQFPYPQYGLYPYYMAMALSRAVGLVGPYLGSSHLAGLESIGGVFVASAVGWLLLAAMIATIIWRLGPSTSATPADRGRSNVILLLVLYCLMFDCSMVIGRINLGLFAIQASRYVPLIMPGLIGLYFAALCIERRFWRRALVGIMVLLACYSGLSIKRNDHYWMNWEERGKLIWVRTYLASGDLRLAGEVTDSEEPTFSIYPNNHGDHLNLKLQFLRQHKFSFFGDPPPAWQKSE